MKAAMAKHTCQLPGVLVLFAALDYLRTGARVAPEPKFVGAAAGWLAKVGADVAMCLYERNVVHDLAYYKAELVREWGQIRGLEGAYGALAAGGTGVTLKAWIKAMPKGVLQDVLCAMTEVAMSEAPCETWGSQFKRMWTAERRNMSATCADEIMTHR
jgi:hypothetical protein